MASGGDGSETLYATLGVSSTVTAEEVRKVYRKLVLKCHPDKVRDEAAKPEAEKRFQAIVTAYEVLSDTVKRAEYDKRMRLNGAASDDVLVNITLAEALTGATKLAMIPYRKRCAWCAGVGMSCPPCTEHTHGRKDESCLTCGGNGFGKPVACAHCGAAGATDEFHQARVVVPPGVEDGARVKIKDRREHAKINVMASRMFTRRGADVCSTLRMTHKEANDGGFHEVQTLRGSETLFWEAGAKTGDERRLQGKGLPRNGVGSGGGDGDRGDHVVVVEVKRETTPEREAAAAAAAAGGGADAGEPSAKRARTTDDGPPESTTDLEKLLAEKKRQLMAKLQEKKGPVEVD